MGAFHFVHLLATAPPPPVQYLICVRICSGFVPEIPALSDVSHPLLQLWALSSGGSKLTGTFSEACLVLLGNDLAGTLFQITNLTFSRGTVFPSQLWSCWAGRPAVEITQCALFLCAQHMCYVYTSLPFMSAYA